MEWGTKVFLKSPNSEFVKIQRGYCEIQNLSDQLCSLGSETSVPGCQAAKESTGGQGSACQDLEEAVGERTSNLWLNWLYVSECFIYFNPTLSMKQQNVEAKWFKALYTFRMS